MRHLHLAGMTLAVTVAAPVAVLVLHYRINNPLGAPPAWMQALMFGGMGGFFTLAALAMIRARRWGARHGLTPSQALRVVFAPTGKRELWRAPRYAALLLGPAAGAVVTGAQEPKSPDDYRRAIGELADRLSGPARAVGSEAVAAARQLVTALETLDGEVGTLARDADPNELAAVEHKLRALGEPAADEPDVRRQMRELLAGQAALLRRLATQLEAATERRAHLADMLKTLWLQLAALRAEAVAESGAAADLSGRIRALCQDIERHAEAAATIRVMTAGGEG